MTATIKAISPAPAKPHDEIGIPGELFAVVLAAGSARRFGATKQLSSIGDQTLVSRAMRLAERVCGRYTVLVTGHDGRNVAAACEPLAGFRIHNEHYDSGLGVSLATAVAGIQHVAGALLVALADQPLITAEHLYNLVDCYRNSPDHIIASRYAGTVGPPAIFPRLYFPELQNLTGDSGARRVMNAHKDRLVEIEFEDAAHDIDYQEDLDRFS